VWQVVGSLTVLAAITLMAVRFALEAPYAIVGWLWYLGTLVPVLGIVQGGLWPAIAERFLYVPETGLFICLCFGVHRLVSSSRFSRVPVAAAFVALIAAFSFMSWRQASYWKDNYTLNMRAIEIDPSNYVARVNLAVDLCNHGKYEQALVHCRNALAVHPTDWVVLSTLARVYKGLGRMDEAVLYLKEAARYDRQGTETHYDLALYYAEQGETDKALNEFQKVLELNPDHGLALYNIGVLEARKGNLEKAEASLVKAMRLRPNDPDIISALGMLMAARGKKDQAEDLFRRAKQAGRAENVSKRATGAAGAATDNVTSGRPAGVTASDLEKALKKDPGNVALLQRAAVMKAREGKYDEALVYLERIVRLRPQDPSGYYNVACMHARKGEAEMAVEYLRKALGKGFKDWGLISKDQDLDPIRKTEAFRRFMGEIQESGKGIG
jgi:tetratricopeptide (TPR) repeat protein